MDNSGWISVDSFKINRNKFNFKNKNIIEEVCNNKENLIIRIERLSESKYKVRFLKKDIEGSEIEVEYEDDFELEIKCSKCGRNMKYLITKYPLSDSLIYCYSERFYNCSKVEGGCGYKAIIGLDEY